MQNLSQIKATLSALVGCALLFALTSQSVKAETPTYKIEVIIFESLALKGWTEEYWPDDINLPNTNNALSVFSRGKKPLFINSSDKKMGGKAYALNKKGYRVLFHQAWTQRAYPNKKSTQVLLEGSDKYGTNMLGTVRLYKTRYAHVDFNLHFDRRIPSKIRPSFANNQKLNTDSLPSHWSFKLKESRKIKPGELHYIDHPLFGALVKISKL